MIIANLHVLFLKIVLMIGNFVHKANVLIDASSWDVADVNLDNVIIKETSAHSATFGMMPNVLQVGLVKVLNAMISVFVRTVEQKNVWKESAMNLTIV